MMRPLIFIDIYLAKGRSRTEGQLRSRHTCGWTTHTLSDTHNTHSTHLSSNLGPQITLLLRRVRIEHSFSVPTPGYIMVVFTIGDAYIKTVFKTVSDGWNTSSMCPNTTPSDK